MATSQASQPKDGSLPKDVDEGEAMMLAKVADKLVCYGRRVGVTPDEMISLLDSGISIRDLLAFLASKSSGAT
jgi:hypothetical protein